MFHLEFTSSLLRRFTPAFGSHGPTRLPGEERVLGRGEVVVGAGKGGGWHTGTRSSEDHGLQDPGVAFESRFSSVLLSKTLSQKLDTSLNISFLRIIFVPIAQVYCED